jgi:HAE1 family hydrophobic/amphiphilic exporter-1
LLAGCSTITILAVAACSLQTSGGEPAPPAQQETYTVRARGRLLNADEFGNIILRVNPDGSLLRLSDVARIQLGAEN